jgi:hypothetical protein
MYCAQVLTTMPKLPPKSLTRLTFIATVLGLTTAFAALPSYAEGYGGYDFDLSDSPYAPKLATQTAVLAPGSVSHDGYPSGSYSYGFSGYSTTRVSGVPMTSTGSVDINTVSQ